MATYQQQTKQPTIVDIVKSWSLSSRASLTNFRNRIVFSLKKKHIKPVKTELNKQARWYQTYRNINKSGCLFHPSELTFFAVPKTEDGLRMPSRPCSRTLFLLIPKMNKWCFLAILYDDLFAKLWLELYCCRRSFCDRFQLDARHATTLQHIGFVKSNNNAQKTLTIAKWYNKQALRSIKTVVW